MTATPRTLLQIVNQAQAELGLPVAATVIGNADPSTAQMLAMAQKIGEEIRDTPEDGWTTMHVEFNLAVSTPITGVTGNTSLNSPVITNVLPNTTGMIAGSHAVSGANIPTAARILSVNGANQITLTMEATGAATSEALSFARDTYSMPADFRSYSNKTFWDRTNHWELLGPDSPQADMYHRSGIFVTGPRRHFRNVGRIPALADTWRLWPPPFEIINPIQLSFEYITTDWISLQGGAAMPPSPPTYASTWANDTDIPVLDDRAMIDGVKWMFWKMKGFAYLDARQDWVDLVDRLIARDGGARNLQLGRPHRSIFLGSHLVQDGFWPQPTP